MLGCLYRILHPKGALSGDQILGYVKAHPEAGAETRFQLTWLSIEEGCTQGMEEIVPLLKKWQQGSRDFESLVAQTLEGCIRDLLTPEVLGQVLTRMGFPALNATNSTKVWDGLLAARDRLEYGAVEKKFRLKSEPDSPRQQREQR